VTPDGNSTGAVPVVTVPFSSETGFVGAVLIEGVADEPGAAAAGEFSELVLGVVPQARHQKITNPKQANAFLFIILRFF